MFSQRGEFYFWMGFYNSFFCSANLEEVMVRATIAEHQRRFMDDIKIEEGEDEDRIQDENHQINTNLVSSNTIHNSKSNLSIRIKLF